ncbi:phosphatidylinositol-3,5-bisphosphate 3-phosphatase MTMR14 isoform X7 [Centroberyx affinis]|uniref:phosphatidylinositol-3,5-bisphosphate 3-phosphatase MTMR14 isoform X7 n=1 Tax=Centroberyx affinis TaxID=166261 RepID=UPI003A5B9488
MMAASPSAAGGFTASGLSVRKSEEIADLIDLFSKTQYRAKEVTPRVETIEKRCLELFGRDYKYSVIHNTNGEVCGHYPRQIVYLEYECTEVQRDRNGDSQLFDKVRGHDIKLLRYLSVRYICDLMVENKKVKFGLNVTSSEKVDKAQRYADFTLLSVPYPGCEFFKDYKDRDYTAEGLVFNWNQSWDLVEQTQNYLKLLLHIINSDDESGLLVHCISGWDRTPLFVSLLRLSLWADGAVHASLEPAEILYLTIAYDWFLFGHMLPDRLSKGEEIFFFCFNFLKHIVSEKFSAIRKQRRKNSHFKDSDFTVEDLCQLKSRDRGSVTSLSSDFSLITEEAGAASSLTNDAVDLMPSRAPAAARWCPIPSERQARLEAVREVFLAAYSSTVGLKSSAPSPSGAISGLLEQFARGVGLRGTNTIV